MESAVAWFYASDGATAAVCTTPCDDKLSSFLEVGLAAYLADKDDDKLRFLTRSVGKVTYTFDLELFLQRNESTGKVRAIKRFAVPSQRVVSWRVDCPDGTSVQLAGYSAALLEHAYMVTTSKLLSKVDAKVEVELDPSSGAAGRAVTINVASMTVEGSASSVVVRSTVSPTPPPPAPVKRTRSATSESIEARGGRKRTSAASSTGGIKCFRLLFPSISTNIFMFDVDRAALIATAVIYNFLSSRPVSVSPNHLLLLTLVDAPSGPDSPTILAFKSAWAKVNKTMETRLTFLMADIGNAAERGPCRYIANAANEVFSGSPQTGGFNRALHMAAGWKRLQADTRAKYPSGGSTGPCYDVPLAPESPLRGEGVCHVLHVVGPNMNPTRPNCITDVAVASKMLALCYENLLSRWAQLVSEESKV